MYDQLIQQVQSDVAVPFKQLYHGNSSDLHFIPSSHQQSGKYIITHTVVIIHSCSICITISHYTNWWFTTPTQWSYTVTIYWYVSPLVIIWVGLSHFQQNSLTQLQYVCMCHHWSLYRLVRVCVTISHYTGLYFTFLTQ